MDALMSVVKVAGASKREFEAGAAASEFECK
jgi:hypothetical protein